MEQKINIGIGITTTPNRKAHKDLCNEQLTKFMPAQQVSILFNNDSDGEGVTKSKNNCIHVLKECDYIFLFDDDCFPIREGWTDFFINTGLNHLLYMNDTYTPVKEALELKGYLNCSGCFIFITKKVIEKVGYFNPAYDKYGFEHAGYSTRIHKAGLSPFKYPCLNGTENYIYSLDHQGTGEFKIEHNPSLTQEEREKSKDINRQIFMNEDRIYYGFS